MDVVNVLPNQVLGSWSIFQAKVTAPTVRGAVAVNVNTAFCPALIGEAGNATRLSPHVVLSCGLCEPNWYGVAPLLVQTVAPLLFIVIVAVKPWPGATPTGTLLLTNVAPFPAAPITSVATR